MTPDQFLGDARALVAAILFILAILTASHSHRTSNPNELYSGAVALASMLLIGCSIIAMVSIFMPTWAVVTLMLGMVVWFFIA